MVQTLVVAAALIAIDPYTGNLGNGCNHDAASSDGPSCDVAARAYMANTGNRRAAKLTEAQRGEVAGRVAVDCAQSWNAVLRTCVADSKSSTELYRCWTDTSDRIAVADLADKAITDALTSR